MATIATLVVKLKGDIGDFRSKMEESQSLTQRMTSAVQGLGAVTIAGGLGAVTGAIGGMAAVIKTTLPLAQDFQEQLVGLEIAASGSGLSFDQLHDAALAVGGDTSLLGVSATGAADAMTGLYKAGLSTTEIFGDLQGYLAGTAELGGALRAAIDLAAATELDMVQASDLAAVALATFGGELETEAERAEFVNSALNNMVQAADASVAEVSGLADALRNVGPTASALGISIEDTNNALAILSTRGIQGAEAGTALKSMLTNIQRPTKEVKEALTELGVSLYDAKGEFVGLPNLVDQLSGALNGTREITEIVGGRTEEQNKLLEQAQARYEQLTKRIQEHNLGMRIMSDKALAKAQTELQNTKAVIDELNAIEGEAITTTIKLTDEQRNQYIQTIAGTYGMNALNTLLAEGTEGWNDMAKATANAAGIQKQAAAKAKTFAGRMEALQGTIETLKIGIGEAFLPVATDMVNLFSNVADQVGPLVVDFFQNSLAPALDMAAGFVDSFVAALLAGQGPVVALQGALCDIGLDQVADAIGTVVEKVQELWTAAQPYVEMAMQWIAEHVELKDVLIALGIAIAAVVIPAVYSIITAAAPVIAAFVALVAIVAALRQAWESDFLGIRTFMLDTLAKLRAWWAEHGDTVIAKAQEIWNTIRETVVTIATQIGMAISEFLAQVRAWWAEHGDEVMAKAREIWEAIVATFEWFKEQFTKIYEAFRLAFEGDWRGFGEKLREVWDAAWENIKKTGEITWNIVKDFFQNTDWAAIARAIIDGIANGIRNGAGAIANAARSAARAAYEAALGFLGIGSPSKLFMEIGTQTMAGMALGISQAVKLPQAGMNTALEVLTPRVPVMAAVPAPARGGVVIHNHFGPGSVRSDEDVYQIAEAIEQSLTLRGVRRAVG